MGRASISLLLWCCLQVGATKIADVRLAEWEHDWGEILYGEPGAFISAELVAHVLCRRVKDQQPDNPSGVHDAQTPHMLLLKDELQAWLEDCKK